MEWDRKLRTLGIEERIILLSSSTRVADEALTGSYLRPVEIEELIKRDMKQSLSDSVGEYVSFVSEQDILSHTTNIRGHLAVVPDVQELIESIDNLIGMAYDKGYQDGMRPKPNDGNTLAGDIDNG